MNHTDATDLNADDRAAARGEAELGQPPHLTDDQLNAVVDGDESSRDWAVAQRHLSGCGRCQAEVTALRATRNLLRSLPSPPLRRSFRLSEADARRAVPWWRSWGRFLLPGMAGLRVATAAVALLLLAVTATDVLTNRGGDAGQPDRTSQSVAAPAAGQVSVPSSEPPTTTIAQAPVVATTLPKPPGAQATTAAPAVAQAAESSSAAANRAPAAAADGAAGVAKSAPVPAESSSGAGASSAAFSPASPEAEDRTAVNAATAAPSTPAPPPPLASPSPAPATPLPATPAPSTAPAPVNQSGDVGMSRWRVAELALLLLLGWLLVSLAGVRWTRRRSNGQGGDNAGN